MVRLERGQMTSHTAQNTNKNVHSEGTSALEQTQDSESAGLP